MKAKLFKKLRPQVKWYYVRSSSGLFGSFTGDFKGEEVLARNPREAVSRFLKRYHRHETHESETTYEWAEIRVILKDKPFDRYTTYWW